MSINLAAEFVVSGLLPFLTISFTILSVLGVYDLKFLCQAEGFTTLLALAAALSMYLLGALMYRLNDLLNTRSMKLLKKIWPWLWRQWKKALKKFLLPSKSTDPVKWMEAVVLILQSGSERLNDTLMNDWSLLRIFKSTAFTAPVLAIPLCIWLYRSVGLRHAVAAGVVCALVACAAAVSFRIQRERHWITVATAVELIRKPEAAQ